MSDMPPQWVVNLALSLARRAAPHMNIASEQRPLGHQPSGHQNDAGNVAVGAAEEGKGEGKGGKGAGQRMGCSLTMLGPLVACAECLVVARDEWQGDGGGGGGGGGGGTSEPSGEAQAGLSDAGCGVVLGGGSSSSSPPSPAPAPTAATTAITGGSRGGEVGVMAGPIGLLSSLSSLTPSLAAAWASQQARRWLEAGPHSGPASRLSGFPTPAPAPPSPSLARGPSPSPSELESSGGSSSCDLLSAPLQGATPRPPGPFRGIPPLKASSFPYGAGEDARLLGGAAAPGGLEVRREIKGRGTACCV